MKSCRECVHGGGIEIKGCNWCSYPLPAFFEPLLTDGKRWVNVHRAEDCPTYQPREEREAQP